MPRFQTKKAKLLGINLKDRLNFDFHVDTPIKKASKKCHALVRIKNYMDLSERRVLMNAFIKSQFSVRTDVP